MRVDKNQNFNFLFSPALSAIYNVDENNTLRVSFGRAIRNPTLQDQYLRYDVGRAILLGNLNGYDSLVTLQSFDNYRNQSALDRENLNYFNVDPIEPEQVATLELGYRATFFERLFLDFNAYHSWYTQFIGYQFGLDLEFDNPIAPNNFTSLQAYRIAANAQDLVTTVGFSLGFNYYITDELTFNGNYTFNRLDLRGSNSSIIPAYNTPENKFNIGLNGRGYKIWPAKEHRLGFAVNLKWVQGFLFEGSPQFTGYIEDYALTDAQVSYSIPSIYSTFKIGASNLLNNEVYQVYGGLTIGRLAYFSIIFENFN
ncbi:MAG: TonB-dependent receptor [Owenweeksia sp.]|nr:TonB-dependent receptor [Owenweeksia sp.]